MLAINEVGGASRSFKCWATMSASVPMDIDVHASLATDQESGILHVPNLLEVITYSNLFFFRFKICVYNMMYANTRSAEGAVNGRAMRFGQ
jgi:hypothetical protein